MLALKDKVIVFIKNIYPKEKDPRIVKEVEAVRENGCNVILLLWNRERKEKVHISQKDRELEYVLNLRAPYGFSGIAFLPVWWMFVMFKLIKLNWDIAHVIDFQSIIPALIIGYLKRKPVIYEIEDSLMDDVILPSFIKSIFEKIERIAATLSSAIIVVDELLIDKLHLPLLKTTVIYDSAPDILNHHPCEIKKNTKDALTIFYAGSLPYEKKRYLRIIVDAISNLENTKVIFAGYGKLVEEIRIWEKEYPGKVEFIGWIPYEEALKISLQCDLLFDFKDPRLPSHQYICGSKIFQAMMCKKPILVNNGTSVAIKVKKEMCGLIVDINNIEEIERSIVKLKNDRELCKKLGENGRKAYERIYSWEQMKHRLLNIYLIKNNRCNVKK